MVKKLVNAPRAVVQEMLEGFVALAPGQGAEATASMSPRLGRASYLGERAKGIPDAGAAAVVIWMQALRGRVG